MLRSDASRTLQQRTAAHYEAYPFDFLTPADETGIAAMQPPPFRTFVGRYATPGLAVAEIGCGPGRGTLYLVRRGAAVTAVDISYNSIRLARGRAPGARYVLASNLALPFAGGAFDLVVSDGVIHHTPDARRAFAENVRILKPGGHLYLGVYNRRGHYYYLYNYFGPPIRWLERHWLGRAAIYATVFPVYYAAHLIKSRGKRTLRGARNFFYDYIITPRASFHTREEITDWCAQEGLDLLTYDPSPGNVHVFVLRKRAS